jgi:hypothetical protein
MSTGVGRQARAAEICAFLRELGVSMVGESEFSALCVRFTSPKADALRKVIRECGLPLSPVVEGVRQESFAELERTLTALSGEYEREQDRERRRVLRRLVITAKDHARFASRRSKDEAKRREKEEMVLWMIVWLENPVIFPQWVKLRRLPAS